MLQWLRRLLAPTTSELQRAQNALRSEIGVLVGKVIQLETDLTRAEARWLGILSEERALSSRLTTQLRRLAARIQHAEEIEGLDDDLLPNDRVQDSRDADQLEALNLDDFNRSKFGR